MITVSDNSARLVDPNLILFLLYPLGSAWYEKRAVSNEIWLLLSHQFKSEGDFYDEVDKEEAERQVHGEEIKKLKEKIILARGKPRGRID